MAHEKVSGADLVQRNDCPQRRVLSMQSSVREMGRARQVMLAVLYLGKVDVFGRGQPAKN